MRFSQTDTDNFVDNVLEQGKKHYRDFPWRNIDDPYQVLVSEVMLQQTQVVRVLRYWERFITLFPSIDALAAADKALVLEQWQGLGYNRRVLALKRTAEICSRENAGMLPSAYESLLELPGIGKATAGGIMAFAHNQPVVYLETNVRTVFIHEFFDKQDLVHDKELEPLVAKTCSQTDPRAWYYALLDYGAYLKQTIGNPSRKSVHYTKQTTFVGSNRQKRAELLRLVLSESDTAIDSLYARLNEFECQAGRQAIVHSEFEAIVDAMVAEGFFSRGEGALYA